MALFCLGVCHAELVAEPKAPWLQFSTQPHQQRQYHQTLFAVFKRFISDPEVLNRLAHALKNGSSGFVTRDQILDDYDLFGFSDFVSRVHVQMEPPRRQWMSLEDDLRRGRVSYHPVQAARQVYLDKKISVDELLVVYDFYRQIGRAPESFFSKNRPIHRSDILLALKVKSITLWPLTPRRAHDTQSPKVALDQKAWSEIYEQFKRARALMLLDELWSQFVNPQSGGSTTRHIVGFEDAFLWHCQRISKKEPYRAVALLMGYLINKVSSQHIYIWEEATKNSSAVQPSLPDQSVSSLLIFLKELRNRQQIEKFFQAKWPERLGFDGETPVASAIVRTLRRVFTQGPSSATSYMTEQNGEGPCAEALKKSKP